MKTMIYSMALAFSLFASCAFADSGAKPVVNCQENEQMSAAGQIFNSLQTLQVFQEQDGSYRYSASITPVDETGAIGAPAYSSSGEVVAFTGGFASGQDFQTSDGSIRAVYIGCGHCYIFDDQKKDVELNFSLSSCQFN